MSDSKATILVVDDESANREVICAQLKHEGYDIVTAADGEAALACVDARLPDLILLDAMMPGISGFDVAEILKAEERTANIPIIMITALGDSDSRLAALTHGVEEFLTKPVARVELVIRIRNLLKLKKYQDQLKHYSSLLEGTVAERTTALETVSHQLDEVQKQLLQSEKMAALGQLAAGVAHEINNPIGFVNANLGALKGYVKDMVRMIEAYEASRSASGRNAEVDARLHELKQELELDFLCDDAPALIDESLKGLERVCRIVQDLKSFSRADSKATPDWVPAQIHECLESTINIAHNEIKYKASVVTEFGDLPEVECIPSQLNQVFLNLLVNAAQSISGPKKGEIAVRTGCRGQNVWIEVSDTGCGISTDNMKKIFDPFFTTKPVGQGTGLGLSLSYGIIQRHNGTIHVASKLGKGTTFRISLPIHHQPTPAGDRVVVFMETK